MWARCARRVLTGSSGIFRNGCKLQRWDPYMGCTGAALLAGDRPWDLHHRLSSGLAGSGSLTGHTPHLVSALRDTEDPHVGAPLGTDEAHPSFGIEALVDLLRQENARDLCVIRVPPEVKYAEYFVIASGSSTRHIKAMAQYTLKVYKYLKSVHETHVCIEGKDTDDWLCIDFGNIVVHFMLEITRERYELEKLWTLRSYDDQLSQVAPEILPEDFMFGLKSQTDL
ncbi:mitochondrial assembly of ribosomal large subunit protein 1 [Discoglossus pictus]